MVLPLAIDIQISTGRCFGRGTIVISSSWVPPIGNPRWARVILALVIKYLLVKAFDQKLKLIFK